jgi:hypothetical protein
MFLYTGISKLGDGLALYTGDSGDPVFRGWVKKSTPNFLSIDRHLRANRKVMVHLLASRFWGYAKARFRQVVKKTTKDGKREVPLASDACTTDILRCFATAAFALWMRIGRGLQLHKQLGVSRNKRGTGPYRSRLWTA